MLGSRQLSSPILVTCSGLRHLSDDHLSSSDLSSRCLEVYIVIPHLHDLLLLITIVIMTIMLTIMTSPVPRASLSPGETRPGDSPAARQAVHQQCDKVIVIIANRSRLRWNKSWCSQHQIFIFKTPTRPSNNPRPDNDSDNSDNDNDNNQAVQQPQHPKQLHSTCTSTCTCTCAAVQVETFATVREAVKYYFAERYHHSAKKYLTAFLTGKKSSSELSNASQQQ